MRTELLVLAVAFAPTALLAQDDLLQLLGNDSTKSVEYTTASFKSTRVINGHSLENTPHGVLDFRIGHRFGFLSTGVQELYGLDQATIRLGFDYGLTDRLMVGFGRSSYQKTLDGFAKFKVLRQCDQGCRMPVTVAVVAAASATTLAEDKVPWYFDGIQDYFTHRLAYSFQAVVGRKFSEEFSLQLTPGVVHRNLVAGPDDRNDLMNIGIAGRLKLSKRVAVNAEYFYVLPDQGPREAFHNSLAVGFDIETGGHVFQLHFTNSTGMFERAFITETTGDFFDGDIHFGFNISRVFTLYAPKAKAKGKLDKASPAAD
ncbi:MAG: hypothetical protein JST38_19320 [Bacteroidetes bacterium]|nr:hypothetical protein [Bacteroidota bacterium]MBS1943018.1 hypothetical protein [Bacteroidota bacterium]